MQMILVGIGTTICRADGATFSYATKQNLASAALSATTNFQTDTSNYLAYVSLHFSAAPTSAETITVSVSNRNGANYNTLLAKTVTVASTTTDVAFVFASSIPVNTTDQIKVTCTNATGSGTVYLTVVTDTVQRSGIGYYLLLDGAVTSTSTDLGSYKVIEDEDSVLTKRRVLNFEGAGVACADDTNQTTCTITGGGSIGYDTIQNESVALTQRTTVNFTGDGIDCTDSGGITVCDVAGAGTGAATAIETEVDFASGVGEAEVAVTGEAWVTTSSIITCACAGTASSDSSHEEGDCALLRISASVSARVNGDGFTVLAVAPDGATGKVKLACIGVS